jgi:hypothetical protein
MTVLIVTMSNKLPIFVLGLLFVLLVESPDERAAALLGQQKCHEEPSYCTLSVPAYGGGNREALVPCLKKVCGSGKRAGSTTTRPGISPSTTGSGVTNR